MEANESGLSSYYHQHHQHQAHPPPQQSPSAAATTSTITSVVSASPTNGTLPPHMVYTHAASSTVTPPSESGKRKRGRPRKYATPEEAAAARKALTSSIPKKKKEKFIGGGDSSSFSSSYTKKSQLASSSVGNAGNGFAPHILTVAAGEDVYQKIMLFMQQSKCEICILSASGSISNPSLRQPATFGGNITYEGRFDIVSLSGSYIHTELGGRSGGLGVCLSSTDGQIIGGGIGGPFKAAGPVQVIVGAFQVETRKDILPGMKADASFTKFQSPVGGTSVS